MSYSLYHTHLRVDPREGPFYESKFSGQSARTEREFALVILDQTGRAQRIVEDIHRSRPDTFDEAVHEVTQYLFLPDGGRRGGPSGPSYGMLGWYGEIWQMVGRVIEPVHVATVRLDQNGFEIVTRPVPI